MQIFRYVVFPKEHGVVVVKCDQYLRGSEPLSPSEIYQAHTGLLFSTDTYGLGIASFLLISANGT